MRVLHFPKHAECDSAQVAQLIRDVRRLAAVDPIATDMLARTARGMVNLNTHTEGGR